MNLTETVKALEARGITVAINLGVHEHCAIDSNCPIAVELRRLVTDAGVTLEQLLEGYTAVTAPDPVSYTLPVIDGKVKISVAGVEVELDLSNVVSEELERALDIKRQELGYQQSRISRLGGGLYDSYLTAIRRATESHILPQLSFDIRELIETGCLVTTDRNKYVFLFPVEYKPEYLVEDGIRYKMADRDIRATIRQVYLKFTVTKEGRFTSASLHGETDAKFQHYHGDNAYDCWGNVTLPRQWDGGLRSLTRLVTVHMRSLATINLDSLLMSHPPDMPDRRGLRTRATEMGREGEIEEAPTEETPRDGWTAGGDAPRTGWGRGRRTGETLTITEPTRETVVMSANERRERRLARFGIENPTDMSQICAICGETSGRHHGGGVICPDEWVRGVRVEGEQLTLEEEMMRRYGRTETEGNMETICALCGERLGDHYGGRAEICPRDH